MSVYRDVSCGRPTASPEDSTHQRTDKPEPTGTTSPVVTISYVVRARDARRAIVHPPVRDAGSQVSSRA